MASLLDLPQAGGSYPVWPAGGPLLFSGDVAAGGTKRFRASSAAVLVYVPAEAAGPVRFYAGPDADSVGYEDAWRQGIPCPVGTFFGLGVEERQYVALASADGAAGVMVWAAREVKRA